MPFGLTPLHLAIDSKRLNSAILKLLIEASGQEIINSPLSAGLYRGFRPLHMAVAAESTLIVNLLLKSGCQRSQIVESGTYTGLDEFAMAAAIGSREMYELLRMTGANEVIPTAGLFRGLKHPEIAALAGHPELRPRDPKLVVSDASYFHGMTIGALMTMGESIRQGKSSLADLFDAHVTMSDGNSLIGSTVEEE